MPGTLDEHVQRVEKLDDDLLLGRLCWYTVHEMRGNNSRQMNVSHASVVAGLNAVGLGGRVPPVVRDHDVFKRVCTDSQMKKVPTAQEGIFENYLLREISSPSENIITRRIVVETVDKSGKKLDYKQLRDIEFDRGTSVIRHRARPDEYVHINMRTLNDITQKVKDDFLAQKGMLTSWSIREFIRSLLNGFGATCVRAGGAVYFLQEARSTNLDALEKFVNGLPDGLAEFHSLPLIDDQKQREMVRKAFEAETSGAIDEVMGEIAEINGKDSKISSDRYARLVTQYQTLDSKTKEYRDLLEVNLGETHSRLSLFQEQILNLRTKVRFSD